MEENTNLISDSTAQNRRHNPKGRRSFFQNMGQFAENSGHIFDVLQAALPYIDARNQGTVQTLMKMFDFIQTSKNVSQQSTELSAASLSPQSMDFEGMLNSVRTVSSIKERDLIDKMLNYFKAKRLYQTYTLLNQNKEHLSAAGSSPNGYGNNPNLIEAIRSILPPEQAANLENISAIMNAMSVMNAMSNSSVQNSNPTPGYNPSSYQAPQYTNSSADYLNPQDMASPLNNQTPTSTYTPSGLQDTVPNYTYHMQPEVVNSQDAKLTKEYISQFTPDKISGEPNTPNIENTENARLYNNITNVYNALNQAGINKNSLPSNNSMNQNSMLNTLTALANSGFFNNQKSTAAPLSKEQEKPIHMEHYPIPKATNYQSLSETSDSKAASIQNNPSFKETESKDFRSYNSNRYNYPNYTTKASKKESNDHLEAASIEEQSNSM